MTFGTVTVEVAKTILVHHELDVALTMGVLVMVIQAVGVTWVELDLSPLQ